MLNAPDKARLSSWSLAFAGIFLASCSSVWGFDDLAVGGGASDGGDASASGDGASGDALADDASVGDAPAEALQDSAHDVGSVTDGPEGGDTGSGASDGAGGDATHPDASTDASDAGGSCSGACAEAPPAGWDLVEVSFSAGAPPNCGSEFAGTSWVTEDTLDAPTPTCGCACGAPSGYTCQVSVEPQCVGGATGCYACGTTQVATSGQCIVPGGTGGDVFFGSTFTSGGSCAASPSTTVPPTSWGGQARACAPTTTVTAAGCTAGSVCAPTADPTFALCIERAGVVACPAGSYSSQHVEYTGVTDSRSCSSCTCGPVQNVNCNGTWYCYAAGCSGPPSNNFGCGFCNTYASGMYVASPSGGSCSASSVSPTGSATPTGATTFCCQ